MIQFERLLFHFESCLHCMLLPDKACKACSGSGLVVRKLTPHARPHATDLHDLLVQLCKDIDLCTCDEEDARAAGDRAMVMVHAARRAGLAQAALRLQTWLHTEQGEMPRGKNGAVS